MFGKNPVLNIPLNLAGVSRLFSKYKKIIGVCAVVFLFAGVIIQYYRFPRYQSMPFLSFRELKALSKNAHPSGILRWKLNRYWKTPLISNEAYYRGVKPLNLKDERLGPYLRVASWNIEKSYQMESAIKTFSSREAFRSLVDPGKAPEGSPAFNNILRQRDRLAESDIILLQEMDYGVKRSGYINAAGELAKAMNMNYTFATEQLEVDPVMLGLEPIKMKDGSDDTEAMEYYKVDPAKYKGAFGCAVLSRYPIKRVQAFQLKNQAYDWSVQEREKHGFFEDARRTGAELVFKNEITREIKTGGRIYFRIDLAVHAVKGRIYLFRNL